MIIKRIRRKKKNGTDENLIPLINIVFLILIFFLAAGALRPFTKDGVQPAQSSESGNHERPTGPVLINADGQITIGGVEQDEASLAGAFEARVRSGQTHPLPVVADRDLAADKLVDVIEAAKAAGIQKIRLVTQRRRSR